MMYSASVRRRALRTGHPPDHIRPRRRALRGLGQVGGRPQWYRVYAQRSFVGWAWASASDTGLFNGSCGNVIRAQSQGGIWDDLFGPRNPQYKGASAWFQVWHRPTQGFVGWYLVGYHTAKMLRVVCPSLDVFTSHGQAI